MNEARKPEQESWPQGGGEMAALVRSYDWSKTSLGPIQRWPQCLKTAVDLMLESPLAMSLLWGSECVQIYNDAGRALMGTRHPVAFGRPAREAWGKVGEDAEAIHRRVLAGEADTLVDEPWTVLRDGGPSEVYLTICLTPIRDEAGAIAGSLAIAFETNRAGRKSAERRQGEKASDVSAVLLQDMLDGIEEGFYVLDRRARVLYANRQALKVCEKKAEDVLGRPFLDVFSHAAATPAYEAQVRVLKTGEAEHLEMIVPPSDRWFEVDIYPTAAGLAVAFRDIDARKCSEAALRESEERFRQFADYSSNVLWVLDLESMSIRYLSRAFERVWGEPTDRMLGKPGQWLATVHSDDRLRALEAVAKVGLGEATTDEYRIIRSDGAARRIRVTLFPIRDEQGPVRRAGGIAQDVTRYKGNFVYVVDGEGGSRSSLTCMLRDAGYDVRIFSSGTALLQAAPALAAGCVVLDMRRPEAGGLTVPRELKGRRNGLPIVVLGGANSDLSLAVQAMKAGAVDFLSEPYERGQLLTAIASALADIRSTEHQRAEAESVRARIAKMPEREREVLDGLLAGKTNKEIARSIGISPRTVEAHRASVMQRLRARSIPEVVLMAVAGGLQPPATWTRES